MSVVVAVVVSIVVAVVVSIVVAVVVSVVVIELFFCSCEMSVSWF